MNDLKDIEFGLEIDKLEKYFKNRSIAMIGLLDGIGYSPDGYNYLHKMMRSISLDVRRLSVFNAHLQTFNREQYIEDFIASNISLQEVKRIQHYENNMKIENILEEAGLPKDKKLINTLREIWKINEDRIIETDNTTKLRDIIKEHDEVNIFYSANTALINQNTPYYEIEKEKEQRRKNYHYILSLNPKTQIYTIGLIQQTKENPQTREDIEKLNVFYQELASEFGMIYIHPSGLEGYLKRDANSYYLNHEGIADLSFRCMQAMYKGKIEENITPNFELNLQHIKENNNGLESLIEKSIERKYSLENELEKRMPIWRKNFLTERIQEEQEKQKIYKKAKEGYFEGSSDSLFGTVKK